MIIIVHSKQAIKQTLDQQIAALTDLSKRIERSSLPELSALDNLPALMAARRTALGLTVADVAELAAVSANTYRAMERDGANPSLQTLLAVCDVLNLKLWIESV